MRALRVAPADVGQGRRDFPEQLLLRLGHGLGVDPDKALRDLLRGIQRVAALADGAKVAARARMASGSSWSPIGASGMTSAADSVEDRASTRRVTDSATAGG